MKTDRFLHMALLCSLCVTMGQADSDGFYIGVESSVVNFGKDSLKITNKDKSTKQYKDIDSAQCDVKVGYQHFKGNRVELYYRNNKLDTKVGDITTKTYGVNYEWAFSSLSTETIVPYVLVGFGGGKASSSNVRDVDDAEAGEGRFGFGVHYQFNPHIDFQLGYMASSTGFDKFDNDTTDETTTIDQKQLVLGLAYKF